MFVFNESIFLDKASRNSCLRIYRKAKRSLGSLADRAIHDEPEVVTLSGRDKDKLFHSLNNVHKFIIVVKLDHICSGIFCNKETKQRYLDYTLKQVLKGALQQLLSSGEIPASYSKTIDVRIDEHMTATNGRYGLRGPLIQELKTRTFNQDYISFSPPVLPTLIDVRPEIQDSKLDPSIRAADIVANHIYLKARTSDLPDVR